MQIQNQTPGTPSNGGQPDSTLAGQTAILPWRQRTCPWCGSERAECSTSSRYPTVVWVCGVCTVFEVAWGAVAWLDAEAARYPERWHDVRRVMSQRIRTSQQAQVINPDVLTQLADALMDQKRAGADHAADFADA